MNAAEPVTIKSVWELIRHAASCWLEINAPRLGAALAFYTMLSVAPLLVVCVGIAGLVFGTQAAQDQVAAQIQTITGPAGGEAIRSLLAQASAGSHGIIAAGVGFLTLLFGASGVFGELHDSLNLVWGVKSGSTGGLMGMVKYRFFSFAMVIGVGFLLLASLVVSAAIAAAGKFFQSYLPVPAPLLQFASIVVSFLIVTVLFALLYKIVPEVHIQWEDVWIGAAVTSLLFSLGKFLIGLYLGEASIASAYGAAGSMVVFTVWVYYSAQIFFLGAEFTHAFARRHGSRAAVPTPASDRQRMRGLRHSRPV
jgi:membrane protein